MIILPETALSGYYDYESNLDCNLKMHYLLVETIPGPVTEQAAKIAIKYGMYIVCGMP